ncbi:KGG domain-containing protein [Xanthomonas euvesicatoria]|nr:KGG domain-containing protein [Xanthomonas euvesicatoria]
MANQNDNKGGTSNRGFASMDEDKQREIASKGGKAAHESGNAHEFTSEEAREAGKKGGQASGGGNNRWLRNTAGTKALPQGPQLFPEARSFQESGGVSADATAHRHAAAR